MTGAEALAEILESVKSLQTTVDDLKTSIKLIEANIKILNNRAGGLLKDRPIQQQVLKNASSAQVIPQIETSAEDILPANGAKSNILSYKKVFGRLINNNNEPIDGTLVRIYDKNNEVCATAETDVTGRWDSMLRVGRYSAEYTKAGFKTSNKAFDVTEGAKEIEVK